MTDSKEIAEINPADCTVATRGDRYELVNSRGEVIDTSPTLMGAYGEACNPPWRQIAPPAHTPHTWIPVLDVCGDKPGERCAICGREISYLDPGEYDDIMVGEECPGGNCPTCGVPLRKGGIVSTGADFRTERWGCALCHTIPEEKSPVNPAKGGQQNGKR